jgi:acyl-CoA synthetase (AMP-forming)/AMP-acid ligase II
MGSAPVSPALLEAIHRVMPRATVVNAYRTTECGPVVFGPHQRGLPQPPLSVGAPHPDVSLRLVDGGDRSATQGVLEMKSPARMTGYHRRPDLKSPFTEDGFYITGDVFRRDADGFHYFVGRSDDMFVCGGENIYPGELEKLLERHPAVAQACVVPIDDEIKGQKPVAFCVRREGEAVSEGELKRFALDHAPAYMHPRAIWFLDRLPLTTTSKIDRKLLQQRAAGASPSSAARQTRDSH